MRIGFLGMGIMGRAMALNVRKAGFELMVYNRSQDKLDTLRADGVSIAATPQELSAFADVLVLMVTGPEAVDALLFDQGGAEVRLSAKVVVNMSTVPPAYSKELGERLGQAGAAFVEAPVLGTKKPAEDGTLVVLAAGEPATVDTVHPLLESMGKKVLRCGAPPAATTLKLAINLLLGAHMAALAEVLHFAEKCGLERDMVLHAVLAGPMANALYAGKEPMLRNGEYPVQFPLEHMAKDLAFAVDTGQENGAKTPIANALSALYEQGKLLGLSREDFAAIAKLF